MASTSSVSLRPFCLARRRWLSELFGAAGGHGRGDQSPGTVTASELGARPDVTEQNVVGELSELGRDVADEALRGAGLGVVLIGLPSEERGVNSEGSPQVGPADRLSRAG